MIGSDKPPISHSVRRGDFFAIDRRSWAHTCKSDINAMIAYLVLARGTGHDQQTTSWSVNAIETHTGIGRPRARTAIETLVRAGLVQIAHKGTRPRYRIMPAHEVPGCEEVSAAEVGGKRTTTIRPTRIRRHIRSAKGGAKLAGLSQPAHGRGRPSLDFSNAGCFGSSSGALVGLILAIRSGCAGIFEGTR